MQRIVLILSLLVGLFAAWLWALDGADRVFLWASAGQEEAQRALAGALRALRVGEIGAITALWSLCFAYGFFHAIGPGHGKILVAGYGVARRISFARLSVLAFASSLAQGASSVFLVGVGMLSLGWGQSQYVTAAEDWFAPASYFAIALVGCWLVARGVRRSVGRRVVPSVNVEAELSTSSASQQNGTNVCEHCGHSHGPTVEEAQGVRSWADAMALVGAVALRPCSGALFVLILTFRWDLFWQGISAVIAMSIGVASVTVAVAIASVSVREGLLRQSLSRLSDGSAARAANALEILVGASVVSIAVSVLSH